MSQGDGGDISGSDSATQSKQTCHFCSQPYKGKKESKFCGKPCFQLHQKANSKNAPVLANTLFQGVNHAVESEIFSTPKNNSPKAAKSKRPLSANSSLDESTLTSGPKKTRYEDFSSFTDGLDLSQLDSLTKEEITSKLHAALDYAKSQTDRISKLEAELVDVKLAFADSMTLRYINQRSASMAKLPSSVAALPAAPSYSQAVRGHQAPILMASFASSAKPTDRISLAGIEDLLGSTGGGPVPASVRQKDDKIFVRLADPADLERAKSILEAKAGPDSNNVFNSVSRPTKLYPAVALFVNLSFIPTLKEEIMLRNSGLKGKIESVSQLFSKPGSQKGHIKILFNCKETRDLALDVGEVDFFNTTARLVEMLLDREVRRCFKCQGYGHAQASCRDPNPSCGKCAGAHLTRDCTSQTRKCVNCKGAHQSGDRFCPIQMKAVARYRVRMERN
jgi:hypothetical protein